MTWIIQLNTVPIQCRPCKTKIAAGSIYYRATIVPDGRDEYGYDVCAACKKKLPESPEPL